MYATSGGDMALAKSNYDGMSDEDLVVCYQAGDDRAFEIVWSRYKEELLAWATNMAGRAADDVLGELAVRVAKTLPTTKVNRSFAGWLRTVLTNLVIEHHRREGRRPRTASLENVDPENRLLSDTRQRKSPHDELEQGEFAALLHHCLGQLDPKLREAIVLRFWGDETFDQVAQQQGVDVSSAKRRCDRAIEQLKICLTRKRRGGYSYDK